MNAMIALVAVAALFPMMAVALTLPFYLAAWLRRSSSPRMVALAV